MSRPRAHRPNDNERGAALVELAFIGMLLAVIAAGAFDYGMAWRASVATNEAARTGARTASNLTYQPLADYYALTSLRSALTSSGNVNNVQRVVVYKSATADGTVPSACTNTSSTSEKCNILTGAQLQAMTQANFDTTTGCMVGNYTVANWCPSARNNLQISADYLGVWIQIKYYDVFKLTGASVTITRNAVMRLEPDQD